MKKCCNAFYLVVYVVSEDVAILEEKLLSQSGHGTTWVGARLKLRVGDLWRFSTPMEFSQQTFAR